jgi:hypothetical protein
MGSTAKLQNPHVGGFAESITGVRRKPHLNQIRPQWTYLNLIFQRPQSVQPGRFVLLPGPVPSATVQYTNLPLDSTFSGTPNTSSLDVLSCYPARRFTQTARSQQVGIFIQGVFL